MKRILMFVNWITPVVKDDRMYSFFKSWPDQQIEVKIVGNSVRWIHRLEKRLRFHAFPVIRNWVGIEDYDLVIGYGCQSGLVPAALKSLSQKRYPPLVVLDVEGLPRISRGCASRLVQFASWGIDGIVAFSSSYSHRYCEVSEDLATKSIFIPYGLDFTTVPEPHPCKKENYILALGYQDHRFRDWKTLLRAYGKIKHLVRLVIIGRKDLDGVDLGGETVPEEVEFRPFLSSSALAEAVGPALFAVVPVPERHMSIGQGTVLTLMGLQKAVIAADVEGLRDYICDGKTGRLYSCGDSDSLAEIMREWLDHPELLHQIEAAAYSTARTEFSEPLMAKRIHDFCLRLGI
jgi:glycosyltransferase involved in cell wall biosynthesis